MDDKDSTASGSQKRPEETASESQAALEDLIKLKIKKYRMLGLTTVKTIKHKNIVMFDAVKTREILMTKLRFREVSLLCLIGIQVGNRFDNKRLALSQAGQIALQVLTVTLPISTKAENSNTPTLTRVMACFPEVTVAIVCPSVPMILPFEQLQAIHADFPIIARTQVAAAIVPRTLKTEEKRLALALMLVSSLLTSESIHRIKFNCNFGFTVESYADPFSFMRNLKKEAEQALQYVTKYFKSVVLSENRMEYALKYEVVDSDGALSPAWVAAGTASTAWLKDKYDYDISTSPEHL